MSLPSEESEALHQLEQKAERSRADLVSTIDELRQRTSPDALKTGMVQYAQDARQGILTNLRQKANEKPLQAIAVGAGLAYPAWRTLCNLPAPILLIGAGVALAGGSKTSERQNGSSKYPAADLASEHHSPRGLGHVSSLAPSSVGEHGRSDASVAPTGTASVTTSAIPASPTHTGAAQVASSSSVPAAGDRTSWDDLVREVEKHPLVAGGVGLLIGALFAASLPRSRVESQLFGEASDELKSRASEVISSAKVG